MGFVKPLAGTATPVSVPAGSHADPERPGYIRYWDGARWGIESIPDVHNTATPVGAYEESVGSCPTDMAPAFIGAAILAQL